MSDQYEESNSNVSVKGGENKNRIRKPGPAVQAKPLQVVVGKNNFDRASKAFKALVQKERILALHKEKSFFEKPSAKKRRKRNAAARDRFVQERKEQ